MSNIFIIRDCECEIDRTLSPLLMDATNCYGRDVRH
jgi:hypothetical protein